MRPQIINIGIRGLTLSIRFALIFLLAIYLPPEDVGLYGLITVTISYTLYLLGFDFYTFSTRDLLKKTREEWPNLLISQCVLFLLLYIAVLPFSLLLFLYGYLPWYLATLIMALMVTEHLSQELNRLVIAMERPIVASVIMFGRQALWVVFLVLFMVNDAKYRNIESVLLFWLVGSIISILLGSRVLKSLNWKFTLRKIDWVWIRRGISIAFPLLIATLALRAIFTLDRYVFEALNDLALLGAYSLYMGIAGAMLSFMDAGVFAFTYPKMIRYSNLSDSKAFKLAYSVLIKQTFAWLAILIISAAVAAPLLFNWIPEPIYSENWLLLMGVLVSMALFIVSMVPHYGLYAKSEDKPIVFAHIVGLCVFGLALYICSKISPYWAVTVAMGISAITMGILKLFAYNRISRAL